MILLCYCCLPVRDERWRSILSVCGFVCRPRLKASRRIGVAVVGGKSIGGVPRWRISSRRRAACWRRWRWLRCAPAEGAAALSVNVRR